MLSINVFDIQGRLIKRLVDQELGKGDYNTSWEGTDQKGGHLPNGVYLIRIADQQNITAKRVMINR